MPDKPEPEQTLDEFLQELVLELQQKLGLDAVIIFTGIRQEGAQMAMKYAGAYTDSGVANHMQLRIHSMMNTTEAMSDE